MKGGGASLSPLVLLGDAAAAALTNRVAADDGWVKDAFRKFLVSEPMVCVSRHRATFVSSWMVRRALFWLFPESAEYHITILLLLMQTRMTI